ncbi:MAG: copper chaperone PCu(A)C [Rhodospirillaceae bacterium]|jgi:periplasmic copper chaperone A|nr:copper chaperone PCu(A)C [Rhodospirillaceae bacterium]
MIHIARLFVLACIAIAPTVSAQEHHIGDIVVTTPWARATPGHAKIGGAYLTLTTHGATPDMLVAAASPVARTIEFHGHTMVKGVMRMRRVDGVNVEPGEAVTLRPGGLHLMLMGLRAPLAKGQTFPLTLTFKTAGTVTVEVAVHGVGAQMPEHGGRPKAHDMKNRHAK